MSDIGLLQENSTQSQESKRSTRTSLSSVQLLLGIRDRFQNASLKAVSNQLGCPKSKHLSIISEIIQKDQSKFEEFVVTCHALSKWTEKYTSCCKCLMVILVLMQTGPPTVSSVHDSICQFLSNVRDSWLTKDMFLSQFAIAVISRHSFITEHPEFGQHFNIKQMSANGLSLPHIDPEYEVPLLSQVLAMLNRLCGLIQLGARNQQDVRNYCYKEREIVKSATIILYEEAFCLYVASSGILQSILQRQRGRPSSTQNTTVMVMRELYDEQFNSLKSIYASLIALTNDTGVGSCCYGDIGWELSRFPEHSALGSSSSAVSPNPVSALYIAQENEHK